MRDLIVLLLSLWIAASSAGAEIACETVSTLNRLHAGKPLLDHAANARNPAATLGSLQSDMQSLDGPMIGAALSDMPDPRARQALTDLAALTNRMADLAETGDAETLRAVIRAPATELVFARATSALTQLACPEVSTRVGSGATPGRSAQSASAAPVLTTGPKLNFTIANTWILAGIGFVCVAGVSVLRRRRTQKLYKRRSRRFPVNRAVTYTYHQKDMSGRILDISGLGTKLAHHGTLDEAVGSKVALNLGDRFQEAIIMWSNAHYAGLRFDHHLPRAWIRSFLAGRLAKRQTKENGAQRDAASKTNQGNA